MSLIHLTFLESDFWIGYPRAHTDVYDMFFPSYSFTLLLLFLSWPQRMPFFILLHSFLIWLGRLRCIKDNMRTLKSFFFKKKNAIIALHVVYRRLQVYLLFLDSLSFLLNQLSKKPLLSPRKLLFGEFDGLLYVHYYINSINWPMKRVQLSL